jgi:hypothetical protein
VSEKLNAAIGFVLQKFSLVSKFIGTTDTTAAADRSVARTQETSASIKQYIEGIGKEENALEKYNKKLKEIGESEKRAAVNNARLGAGYGDAFKKRGTGTFTTKEGPPEKAPPDKTLEISKARLDLVRQAFESELTLQKEYLIAAAAAYDRAYRDGEISLQEFVAARVKIAENNLALENDVRAKELAAIDVQIAEANKKGDQIAALKLVKDRNLLSLKIDLDGVKLQETITKANDDLKKINREIKLEVRLSAESFTGKVDLDALRQKLEQEAASRKLTLLGAGDTQGVDLLNKGVEAQIQAANARNQLRDTDIALSRISERESVINSQRNAGVISDIDANKQLLELYTKEGEAIAEQRRKLSELFDQANAAGLDVQAESLKKQLAAIDVKSIDTFGKLNAQAKNFGDQFADAFGNAFQSAISGSENFGQALKKNILGIATKALGDAARNIFQQLSQSIAQSIGGNSSGSTGSALASILSKIFSSKSGSSDYTSAADGFSYADGGEVQGFSPHSRADNIRANLTAGEFVTICLP